MASDLIDRKEFIKRFCGEQCGCKREECGYEYVEDGHDACFIVEEIEKAPTVDAIQIDTVAEMLAGLFGDECACNYNHIDQTLAMGCERDSCPDDGDYSCLKKYVEYWMRRKVDGGKQDAERND